MNRERNFVRRSLAGEEESYIKKRSPDNEDMRMYIQWMREKTGKIRSCCEKILWQTDKADMLIDLIHDGICREEFEDISKEIEDRFAGINGHLASARSCTISPDIIENPWHDKEKAGERYLDYVRNKLGCRCFLEKTSIEICLPMLPVRSMSFNGNYYSCYDSRLGEPVAFMLQNELRHANSFNSALYDEKTLHFFFIYGCDEKNIPDSDNHDTKNVQDMICSLFRTGDSGLTTQSFFSTGTTDLIPQRTYIHVTSMEAPVCSTQELIRYWMNKGLHVTGQQAEEMS